ncbi:CoA transferase [Microbulbifer sp. CAU 1566]|uniref:CaiB/BaiF CoA transferase family protein n=1 Tax=Microbulbifer sp. CAU 1566 TaxID=2933269 RepID=UPI00200622EC|nr:CaiB/BaiF CoA-transferase family protein [Microbulbifer sp. CAU 1566]MCK7597518.1 CoA transferase [Microbulbifer sp. CAU 1566]
MGVLSGFRVIELAGMGPCPMAGMLLADMGAEVICVDRGVNADPMYAKDMSRRGKKSVVLDLKSDRGRELFLKLVSTADVLIEGFRPGVMEKLGIGPEPCFEINPELIYGRMTGWGQDGPLAKNAGHDINYIALTGALHAIGPKGEKPVLPLNLVGDFGGGSMFLVMGILGALLETGRSGKGQVVDAAMVDGVANLMWMCHSFNAVGLWNLAERGTNLLDGAAFFYDTYETSDGKYLALGSIEPQFFSQFVERMGLDKTVFNGSAQNDPSQWPSLKQELAEAFRQKTRDDWCALLEDSDACVSPVLSASEAPHHPHNSARDSYLPIDGYLQPAPAPRFSRTPSSVLHGRRQPGADTRSILTAMGIRGDDIDQLEADGTVACARAPETA